ncbi:MAG: hypothetical protein AAGM67_00750 [Bacteroidota bacterium]
MGKLEPQLLGFSDLMSSIRSHLCNVNDAWDWSDEMWQLLLSCREHLDEETYTQTVLPYVEQHIEIPIHTISSWVEMLTLVPKVPARIFCFLHFSKIELVQEKSLFDNYLQYLLEIGIMGAVQHNSCADMLWHPNFEGIRGLTIGHTKLDDRSIAALARTPYVRSLNQLRVYYNPNMTKESFVEMVHNPALQNVEYLCVNGWNLKHIDPRNLLGHQMRSLKSIDMDSCFISETTTHQIADAMCVPIEYKD